MDETDAQRFLIESQEGLDRMERCLTDLEERPQDHRPAQRYLPFGPHD